MALVINTNLLSLNAQRNLRKSEAPLSVAMQRLSSGLRINTAKDDAAGMAMATRMDTQIRGLTVAIRNANDGLSFIQTAEGAVNEMIGDVARMYELAVQAASKNTDADRKAIDNEVQELISELNRVVSQTRYNGELFLNRQISWSYQVGAQVDETITMDTQNLSPTAMGITTTFDKKWTDTDVAASAWSTYKAANDGAFKQNVEINGVHLGGAMPGAEIKNNSRALVDRINKYSKETHVKAMTYGNAVVASAAVKLSSNGAAGDAGFLTINGVAIGSFSKGVIDESAEKAAETAKQAEGAEGAKTTEGGKTTEAAKTAEGAKTTEAAKTAEGAKPAEADKTAEGQPKTEEQKKAEERHKKLENATATNIMQAINDKQSETGVTAAIVSNSRIVLSNTSGGGISYMVNVSRFRTDKGDATKDIDLGMQVNGKTVEGGQNGVVVFNDNRFGQGTLQFDSVATVHLFGYGPVTIDGLVQSSQQKQEVSNNINLNKVAVSDLSIKSAETAKLTMLVGDEILDFLNAFKAIMGAKMNRIDSTMRNLDNIRENLTAAKSRILDADFAQETANLTKGLIIQQAGIAVLSQANVLPQNVLSLLQGKG